MRTPYARVSTKKQVDRNDKNGNDIPMQKTACRDFASAQHDWEIIKEFSEKGLILGNPDYQEKDR